MLAIITILEGIFMYHVIKSQSETFKIVHRINLHFYRQRFELHYKKQKFHYKNQQKLLYWGKIKIVMK